MSIDIRGFSYALEPVRRKQQWQLDALQGKLGRAQRELDDAQAELEKLEDAYTGAIASLTNAMNTRVDPTRHQLGFAYLAQLQQRIDTQQDSVDRHRVLRDEARSACTVQQQKVELIAQHRERCLHDYQLEERQKQSAEADRDWIARSLWSIDVASGRTAAAFDARKEVQ